MASALLDEVESFARSQLILETELRLRIPTTNNIAGFSFHADLRQLFGRRGYTPLRRCETTYFQEIDRSDDELLKSFKAEYRNRIRKMRKQGAEIDRSWSLDTLEDFAGGFADMTVRKNIKAVPTDQVGRSLAPLLELGHCEMFTEKYGDRAANMVIIDALGTPTYALGTRSRSHVRGDIPGAAQLVHFEIMRSLRDRGLRYYDLGGCQGPTPIETDPNYGTWRFKYGFRPVFVRFIPYQRKIRAGLQGALNVSTPPARRLRVARHQAVRPHTALEATAARESQLAPRDAPSTAKTESVK